MDIKEGNTRFVQIRVPVGMIEQIDDLINEKKFSSRSEFFKRLAAEYFGEERSENFVEKLKDPEVRKEIRQILKEGL